MARNSLYIPDIALDDFDRELGQDFIDRVGGDIVMGVSKSPEITYFIYQNTPYENYGMSLGPVVGPNETRPLLDELVLENGVRIPQGALVCRTPTGNWQLQDENVFSIYMGEGSALREVKVAGVLQWDVEDENGKTVPAGTVMMRNADGKLEPYKAPPKRYVVQIKEGVEQ